MDKKEQAKHARLLRRYILAQRRNRITAIGTQTQQIGPSQHQTIIVGEGHENTSAKDVHEGEHMTAQVQGCTSRGIIEEPSSRRLGRRRRQANENSLSRMQRRVRSRTTLNLIMPPQTTIENTGNENDNARNRVEATGKLLVPWTKFPYLCYGERGNDLMPVTTYPNKSRSMSYLTDGGNQGYEGQTQNASRKFTQTWNFGGPTMQCPDCGARVWREESVGRTRKFSICCQKGKVQLPLLKEPPEFLRSLLDPNGGPRAANFRQHIRAYNSIFAFTSMGGQVDRTINTGDAPYCFRLNGQNHHKIGSLLPPEGQQPRFTQLYIYDTDNEVANRISSLTNPSGDGTSELDPVVVNGLSKMLDEHNELAKVFRMAKERFADTQMQRVRLRLIAKRARDGRQYNLPTGNELAALIVGNGDTERGTRDVIIEDRANGLQRISELHPSFMALQYPLLFPYGEDGYRIDIKHKNVNGSTEHQEEDLHEEQEHQQKRCWVTMREYYAYRLAERLGEANTLILCRRLRQQFAVDAYTCMQETRLQFIRKNQPLLRKEVLSGLTDAVSRGDTTPASLGQRVILPSSFLGGPRYMIQNYQDAMAICRWAGPPDLFITFTCNPKWLEVKEFLSYIPGQRPEDRPDVIARAFKIKVDELMRDITARAHFGRVQAGDIAIPIIPILICFAPITKLHCVVASRTFNLFAAIYTIEFQKRGLPHAHILLFLHPEDKPKTPEDIDRIISAELPDKEADPAAYEAVVQFMLHGPCGAMNKNSPCMQNGNCTKHYPRSFNNATTISEDGYPNYRRRDNGRTTPNGLDNSFVIPHNVDLLIKYQAHINVELCNKYGCIKYLFKYMNKGPDMTLAMVEEVRANGGTENGEVRRVDEIANYLQCRYVSASEACWRIFAFEIQYKHPPVERLTFHLEHQQEIIFADDEDLNQVLDRVGPAKTTLTEWMATNRICADARELTYADFPTKWVWQSTQKRWKRREKGRKIGRIYFAHPASGEKYYLRLLLNVVKGPTSFADIRTVDGVLYPTFKAACNALGMLGGDNEWQEAISEAARWSSGQQLRELFVTILLFCEVSEPKALWERHWKDLSDDILHRQRRRLGVNDLALSDEQLRNYALYELELILKRGGRSLKEFDIPLPDDALLESASNRLIMEEQNYDRDALSQEARRLQDGLNEDQKRVHDAVLQAVYNNNGGLFFVYGSGGTGKTFLWRTLMTRLRSEGRIVLAVASSGIAALLLLCGRTAHSRFCIPVKIAENSTCNIQQGSDLARLIHETSLIIWDEAPMVHRHSFEAVDRTLRDIMQLQDPTAKEKVFGGKTVVLGGDFRQILPVVPKKGRADIIDASISRSKIIWPHCTVCKLKINMRLRQAHTDTTELTDFSKWILDIGDGNVPAVAKEGEDEASWIKIPEDLLIDGRNDPMAAIVEQVYPNLLEKFQDPAYLQERAILAPKNEIVDDINNYILAMIPGEEHTFKSADRICPLTNTGASIETLYTTEFLNTLQFPGTPNHEIKLKVGCPIILLRNINQAAGMCNGTRLIVVRLQKRVIQAVVVTGTNIGERVTIPRVEMSPTDTNLPFTFKRRQFPVKVCFAMTINKSQGQTFNQVGVYLPQPVFSHGQLYVAVSRVTNRKGLKIIIPNEDPNAEEASRTKNVVYREIFENL